MKKLLILLAILTTASAEAQNVGVTKFISVTPTVTAGAYTTGQDVGGKFTLTNACRYNVGTGYITSVTVSDKSGALAASEVVLFGSNPTNSTFTDNSSFTLSTSDTTKAIGDVALTSSNHFVYGTAAVNYAGSIVIPIRCVDSTGKPTNTLYGALISKGSATLTGTSDITLTLGISAD